MSMPEFTPINAAAVRMARLANAEAPEDLPHVGDSVSSETSSTMRPSSSASSGSQNGGPGVGNQIRTSRGAEHLVGSVVPSDAPTYGVHDGRKVKLNFDFRVKSPRSQRTSEGRAANILWCQQNHVYLDADGFVQNLRPDLFTRGQKLAFRFMTKIQNDKAYAETPSVPLTVSSEAERLDWEASLDDKGQSRDPIKFAAHLAMQTVRTKQRLQAEESWARQVRSEQERREVRTNSHYEVLLESEEEDSSSDDGGAIPAIRSATEDRYIAALQGPKAAKVSRRNKRKPSSNLEHYETAQSSFKKRRTDLEPSSVPDVQRSGTSEQVDSDMSSLTDCPSDLDLEDAVSGVGTDPVIESDMTSKYSQQVKREAGALKSRTRLQGRIEYLLPRDEDLQRKIKSEGWPSFSSNGSVGTGKSEPEWRIVGERPVYSREGRYCMRGSIEVDQASQLALRFQHIERPECELVYKLNEPDWDNKEALLTWVKNVQQFLRRRLGPRKSSVPYADEEDAWLIEYAHEANIDWHAVTAGSKDAAALFEEFVQAFPQSAKRNKAGVLLKAKRLLGLM